MDGPSFKMMAPSKDRFASKAAMKPTSLPSLGRLLQQPVRALAPALVIEFGVTVSMFALVTAVGTPALQLPAANQSDETAPIQWVWACVATVDAATIAIVASNVDRTNYAAGACL
jgi:hypothetical protein